VGLEPGDAGSLRDRRVGVRAEGAVALALGEVAEELLELPIVDVEGPMARTLVT
jgi:hypothetical protein